MRTSVEYSDAARSSVGAASAALDMPRRKLRRWCRVGKVGNCREPLRGNFQSAMRFPTFPTRHHEVLDAGAVLLAWPQDGIREARLVGGVGQPLRLEDDAAAQPRMGAMQELPVVELQARPAAQHLQREIARRRAEL